MIYKRCSARRARFFKPDYNHINNICHDVNTAKYYFCGIYIKDDYRVIYTSTPHTEKSTIGFQWNSERLTLPLTKIKSKEKQCFIFPVSKKKRGNIWKLKPPKAESVKSFQIINERDAAARIFFSTRFLKRFWDAKLASSIVTDQDSVNIADALT